MASSGSYTRLFLIGSFLLATTTVIFAQDIPPYLPLAAIAIYVFACAARVRFEPVHPMTWYLAFIFVYHASVLILDIIGVRAVGASVEVLTVLWVGVAGASAAFIDCGRLTCPRPVAKPLIRNPLSLKIVLIGAVAVLILYNWVYYSLGIVKRESGGYWYLTVFIYLYAFLPAALLLLAEHKPRFPIVFTIALSILILFTALNTGERDLFFYFIVVVLFYLYYTGSLKKSTLFYCALALLVAIPLLGAMKNIFVRAEVDLAELGIVVGLLGGEFSAGGRNLETLFIHREKWDYFLGSLTFAEVIRAFVPTFLYNPQTSLNWYMETFHWRVSQRGQGYGFTLLGEGLINFGYLGVFALMFAVGLLLRLLYTKSLQNQAWRIFYILSVPYFLYSIRADVSNILSPLLKRVLIVLLVIALLDNLVTRLGKHARNRVKPSAARS